MSKLLRCSSRRNLGGPIAAMLVLCPIGLAAAETATVAVEVTFVDSVAISDPNPLQSGLSDQGLTSGESVTIAVNDEPAEASTGPAAEDGSQTAASFGITATPGREMTIYVDSVVPGPVYSMTDFRCSYDSATDVPCDGAGFTETSTASGTLRIGATLAGEASTEGAAEGSFEVTVSYQ